MFSKITFYEHFNTRLCLVCSNDEFKKTVLFTRVFPHRNKSTSLLRCGGLRESSTFTLKTNETDTNIIVLIFLIHFYAVRKKKRNIKKKSDLPFSIARPLTTRRCVPRVSKINRLPAADGINNSVA